MLKFLYPNIDWDCVTTVGFDLDGTLYDEFAFIQQVYEPIAAVISEACKGSRNEIYERLLIGWLEKGSSYNRLFEDVMQQAGICDEQRADLVQLCLRLFRNFQPRLKLSERTTFMLDYLKKHYRLFLVTDGSAVLQQNKFESLGLDRWFRREDVGFTGHLGPAYYKPHVDILTSIKVLQEVRSPREVVYVGDRDVDRQFAGNAGFQFVQVNSLLKEV